MDSKTILENISRIKEEELAESKKYYSEMEESEGADSGTPTDLYKKSVSSARDESKKRRFYGSSAIVKTVTKSVVTGDGQRGAGLAPAYRRAKDDSDFFRKRGENDRADIVRSQYMEDHFLPAVEVIIAYSSPDELLNCKEALSTLDKFALGVGRTNGYTEQYIRSSYGNALGEDLSMRSGKSDDYIIRTVNRVRALADCGSNREAISLAYSAKKSIDEGSHIASDEDYELLGRVASFA